MKKVSIACYSNALLIASVIFLTGCTSGPESKKQNNKVVKDTGQITTDIAKTEAFTMAMNKLWEDHVTWTRNVILCLVDGVPGADQAVNRLMQNQADIGDAIKPYYGNDAGNKLTELLKAHIAISADVVKSAKAGNSSALDEANKKWYANADEIAAFLSSANPNWKSGEMQEMMNDHLKLTTDEAVQRIKKNYDADVKAYDKVHEEILKMSNMLAEGIIMQYPDKFK